MSRSTNKRGVSKSPEMIIFGLDVISTLTSKLATSATLKNHISGT